MRLPVHRQASAASWEKKEGPRLSHSEPSVPPPPSATPTPVIISPCATETLCVLHPFRPPLMFLFCRCTFIEHMWARVCIARQLLSHLNGALRADWLCGRGRAVCACKPDLAVLLLQPELFNSG